MGKDKERGEKKVLIYSNEPSLLKGFAKKDSKKCPKILVDFR